MSADAKDPCELAEIVYEKPLAGAFKEVLFGSDRGNTLWVKFSDKDGVNEWIGKFGVGGYGAPHIQKLNEPDKFLITAGGFAYLVDATNRKLINQYSGEFVDAIAFDTQTNQFVISDGIRVRGIESGKEIWASRRIALDGIRDLELEGRVLKGLAVVGFEGEEAIFTLDLDSLEIQCPVDYSSWDHTSYVPSKPLKAKPWWRFW